MRCETAEALIGKELDDWYNAKELKPFGYSTRLGDRGTGKKADIDILRGPRSVLEGHISNRLERVKWGALVMRVVSLITVHVDGKSG